MTSFTIQEKKKIIFFGDSITRNGAEPGGYIRLMDSLATKEGMKDRFELVGAGIGGNKVYDLYLRLEEDVLSKRPDVVFIYIGVNDVWHREKGTGTDLDKFEKFYRAIISKITTAGAEIVLVTPAVIGEKTDHGNGMDSELNEFSMVIRNLAKEYNFPVVDLRKAFLVYNQQYNPSNKDHGILTTDRVHLNDNGNRLVAQEMWKILKLMK